jgi:hypothetical protein
MRATFHSLWASGAGETQQVEILGDDSIYIEQLNGNYV